MSEIRADKLHNVTGDNDSGIDLSTNDVVAIDIAGSEKARVDSSGNLLVGTTDSNLADNSSDTSADNGIALTNDAKLMATRNNGTPVFFNRCSSDGAIIEFRRSGSVVGSMGVASSTVALHGGGTDAEACGFIFVKSSSTPRIVPCQQNFTSNDDVVDLGHSSNRFDDIFATNGTIQTSDQQEKNTIEDSDLGLDFIKRLSPKSYIFNGKTRTHYGLIAQDVETVLSDINKPTSGFAGFIKDDISEEQDGSSYRYGLRYTEFVAPLIKAIKEQQTIIENLQARITALESE